ncbi:MAG: hypothetical protein E7462_02325 [Ruminococcaceae bacterium]|nr:hypothetical protein [Oscillospiraceae bacterium]
MKKFIALLLALVMVMGFAACANTTTPTEPTDPTQPSNPTEPTQGNTTTVMTHAEYLAAEEDAPVEIEAYVQATQSWYNDAIVIYAQDKSYGGYFGYNIPCSQEDAAKLVPGTKINIKGFKTFYKGMPEIAADGAVLTILEGEDTYIAPAEILTEKLGQEELVKHAGQFACFKGLTVKSITFKNDEPGDDIYVDFTLGDATYSFCVERYLTDPETDVYKDFVEGDVKVGDVVDVYGFVYWYDGINTHITEIS